MKDRTAYFVSVLVLSSAAACQDSPQTVTTAPSATPVATATQAPFKPISSYPPVVLGKPYPGKGVIKLINRKENWIEINHEEIVDLMPAMEMEFYMDKSSLFDGLNVGDKVSFTVVETKKKGQHITSIKTLQE